MKVILLLTFLYCFVGCTKSKIELGLNLSQLESRVNKSESEYLKEMGYIFSHYDLILYDIQSIRESKFFYFIERTGFFSKETYIKEVKSRLDEKGWFLVKKDNYSELYCNNKNQAIGITFPTNKQELDSVHRGYFTYQFFKKASVTLHYTSGSNSVSCPQKKATRSSV